MSPQRLQFEHVSKVFERRSSSAEQVVAVDDVSFGLASGEIVAVVGESGAGKSTLGRLVLGLEHPTSGQVLMDGDSLSILRPGELRVRRRRMHLIAQDPYQSLHPGMRVEQIVAEPLAISGVSRRERSVLTLAALERVGLVPADRFNRRHPHQLSGGQRQRVALARAMIAQPDIVVADEPTSMLDASLCAGILELILQMRQENNTTFVYITHTLAVARYVADRILVMHRGSIVEDGSAEQVVEDPVHPYTRLLLAASEGDTDRIADYEAALVEQTTSCDPSSHHNQGL